MHLMRRKLVQRLGARCCSEVRWTLTKAHLRHVGKGESLEIFLSDKDCHGEVEIAVYIIQNVSEEYSGGALADRGSQQEVVQAGEVLVALLQSWDSRVARRIQSYSIILCELEEKPRLETAFDVHVVLALVGAMHVSV